MTGWFQKTSANANINYIATFDRKQQLAEMAELFYKFDQDGSGTLDLHELCDLFKSAGLKVPSKKLKDMFRLTNAIKHNKDDLSVEDF